MEELENRYKNRLEQQANKETDYQKTLGTQKSEIEELQRKLLNE